MARDYEDDSVDSGQRQRRIRLILIGLVALVLVCLVLILVYRVLTEGGDEGGIATPTPTLAPTEGPTVIVTVEEEPTSTPTRVLAEQPTTEPTTEPAPVETPTATPVPTPTPAPTAVAAPGGVVSPGQIANLLENGDFEKGVGEQGVGLGWSSFSTHAAIISFSAETAGPHVKAGSYAQRISIAGATQPDRYGGIFQQVAVVPNQTYTLTLNGQIRTGLGDINASSYGYRMQYAVDDTGNTNWRNVPPENWIELPWDEQKLDASDVQFLEFSTTVTPASGQLTLFIRGWNKWAEAGLAEYTLDELSLEGPLPAGAGIAPAGGTAADEVTPPANGEQLIPVTGNEGSTALWLDGRFWGALLILLLLAAGAIYRGRWGY